MATREYLQPVGTDLRDGSMQSGHIEGVYIDNPSGSWLRVTGIERFVPPYTAGWSARVKPGQTSVDVLFVASPSGTPSSNIGGPTLIRLSDIPFPDNPGYSSGAEEIQTQQKGNITYRFDVGVLTETFVVDAIVFITPGANIRFVPIRWRCNLNASAQAGGTTKYHCHSLVTIDMTGGLGSLFPTATLSPDRPDSGYLPPTGRQLAVGDTIEIGGMVDEGGGAVRVTSYLEMYLISEP